MDLHRRNLLADQVGLPPVFAHLPRVCREIGIATHRATPYANGTVVSFRNGDGFLVAALLDNDASYQSVVEQLRPLYKVKAHNLARAETLKKVLE